MVKIGKGWLLLLLYCIFGEVRVVILIFFLEVMDGFDRFWRKLKVKFSFRFGIWVIYRD